MANTEAAALRSLLSRCSIGPKHLVDPGPDEAALQQMAAAALRAPDHAGLTPFRFALVRGAAREQLADLFAQAADAAGRAPSAIDRERALGAPVTIAVIARIDAGHPVATVHEQWMAVGGAVTNFVNAAHMLGFGAKMLSGSKVRAAPVVAAFCTPGETLVGWIVLGTPSRQPTPKFDKPAPDQILRDWTGPGNR